MSVRLFLPKSTPHSASAVTGVVVVGLVGTAEQNGGRRRGWPRRRDVPVTDRRLGRKSSRGKQQTLLRQEGAGERGSEALRVFLLLAF